MMEGEDEGLFACGSGVFLVGVREVRCVAKVSAFFTSYF